MDWAITGCMEMASFRPAITPDWVVMAVITAVMALGPVMEDTVLRITEAVTTLAVAAFPEACEAAVDVDKLIDVKSHNAILKGA
jgi:hypothetical protein